MHIVNRGRVAPLYSWLALALPSIGLALILVHWQVPASLLLGPMIVAVSFACGGATLSVRRPFFIAAQGAIGALVGRTVTPAIISDVAGNAAVIFGFVCGTVLAAAIVGWLLARFTGLGAETAAWGSSPGGASAMVAAAADFGADTRIVALMQYLRVMLVVLSASSVAKILLGSVPHASIVAVGDETLPPIGSLVATLAMIAACCLAATRLRIPAGALLLSMVTAAALSAGGLLSVALPWWLVGSAYAVVGWYVGLAFSRDVVRDAFRSLPMLVASTLLLIGLCAGIGEALRGLIKADPLTAYLATSPGGLDSVAIIALGSGANVPLVLAIQTLRVFVVILTGPIIAKFIARTAAHAD